MTYCSKCGKQMDEGLKFCPNCGASTEIPQAEPVAQAQPQNDFSQKV